MAVASLNSLCARQERRLVEKFDCDHRERHGHQLSRTDRNTCHIKQNVFNQSHLVWSGDDRVVHDNSLNFHKTRYKNLSNSTGAFGSIMLKTHGKQKVSTLIINGLAYISSVFPEWNLQKSWLMASGLARNGALSC